MDGNPFFPLDMKQSIPQLWYHVRMPGVRPSVETPDPQEMLKTPVEHEVSSVEADETAWEQSAEHRDDILEAEERPELEALQEAPSASVGAAPAAVAGKDEVIIEVERILEEGLGPYYASLPEEARPVFKQKGEEVAKEVSEMVRTFKFRVARTLQLITDWLKTIPGVNRFFLEQEAKIKTDRIMELIEERRADAERNPGL